MLLFLLNKSSIYTCCVHVVTPGPVVVATSLPHRVFVDSLSLCSQTLLPALSLCVHLFLPDFHPARLCVFCAPYVLPGLSMCTVLCVFTRLSAVLFSALLVLFANSHRHRLRP